MADKLVYLGEANLECALPHIITDRNGPAATARTEELARLMAAAPELMEVLKDILAITDRNHVAWDAARAAIRKARGK